MAVGSNGSVMVNGTESKIGILIHIEPIFHYTNIVTASSRSVWRFIRLNNIYFCIKHKWMCHMVKSSDREAWYSNCLILNVN